MNAMLTSTHPAGLRAQHVPLTTGLAAVTCSSGRLRVDVHDTSRALPAPADAPADAETGRGLIIVGALADEWGFYATPDGKAVYFTLAFQPGGSAK